MLKIGVTGGIGSGKTYVCRILEEMGLAVYDCDREAKRIMEHVPEVVDGLKGLLGEQAYLSDGSLNKPLMASYLFASSEHAADVSAVVHPAVGRDFLDFVEKQKGCRACVMESAILVESGLSPLVDRMVRVEASLETRIQRVKQRDGWEEEEIRRRISRQMSDEEAHAFSYDYIILNDEGADLKAQLHKMLREFKLF